MTAVEILYCGSGLYRRKMRQTLDIGQLQEEHKQRKVGVHRRKTKNKIYESPRILLEDSKDLMGRSYRAYRTKAVLKSIFLIEDTETVSEEKEIEKGDCIILFFPKENQETEAQKQSN